MFEGLNKRLKKLTWVDMTMVKWSAFFAAIIIVKIFPQLLQLNYLTLVILMLACSIRPLYRFWIKK